MGIKVTIIEPGAFRTDFNGRSLALPNHQIDDYASTSGEFLKWAQEVDGKQPGEPNKAAFAMIQAVESELTNRFDLESEKYPTEKKSEIAFSSEIHRVNCVVISNERFLGNTWNLSLLLR